MTIKLWYLNARNNEDKGYTIEHATLKELMDSEGMSSYNFECAELNVSGCVMGGKLLYVVPLRELEGRES